MRSSILILLSVMITSCAQKKENITFQVQGGNGLFLEHPAVVNVDSLDVSQWQLINNGQNVPFDWDKEKGLISFIHTPNRKDTYTLEPFEGSLSKGNNATASKMDGQLNLALGAKTHVGYRYGMHYPPKGVDSIFKKSGFLHPIITPGGDTLTRINPPDHWHHYGMWGPWTHTRIDTTRVDFWNLGEGQGTVLFKEFNSTTGGQVSAGFNAVQEHVDLKTENAPQVALEENLDIRLWHLNRDDRYMLDYTSTFSSPLEDGILFEAYRYGGGLGMRFTERWHRDNCKVLTSEGKDRLEADGSNARWAIVSGAASDGGTNGILFMSHVENRMHPEPMRVWPIDGNGGRGDMFFEFCPIRHEEWQIRPHEKYQLKYRMVVFEGELAPEEAEAYWQAFAKPLQLEVKVN